MFVNCKQTSYLVMYLIYNFNHFYPTDLVNTNKTIPLTVDEQSLIYNSVLRVLVFIQQYSHLLQGMDSAIH